MHWAMDSVRNVVRLVMHQFFTFLAPIPYLQLIYFCVPFPRTNLFQDTELLPRHAPFSHLVTLEEFHQVHNITVHTPVIMPSLGMCLRLQSQRFTRPRTPGNDVTQFQDHSYTTQNTAPVADSPPATFSFSYPPCSLPTGNHTWNPVPMFHCYLRISTPVRITAPPGSYIVS
jgi:hypothetical protein